MPACANDSTTQDRKTIVELPSRVEETIAGYSFVEQIKLAIPDNTVPTDERKSEMARTIAQNAYKTVMELNKHVKTFDECVPANTLHRYFPVLQLPTANATLFPYPA